MFEQPALEALGITKHYNGHTALRDVNLVASPGSLHGLLGPNGAGKTTLLGVILGLIRRDGGTIRLLGNVIAATDGRLPQGVAGFIGTPGFYPYLSGRRNLKLLARLDNGPGSARDTRVASVLEQTGLTAEADRAASTYSTGMRQRLGVAATLLRSPRLLLLDEPTSSLDPAAARDIRAGVRRLADDGAAVVFSSHDMAEVEELCSTVTVINGGRVIYSGTVEALRRMAPPPLHVLCTNNDAAARELAAGHRDLQVADANEAGGGLAVSADEASLDAYVVALGRAGIAVRGLERRVRSLESLFLAITAPPGALDSPLPRPVQSGPMVKES